MAVNGELVQLYAYDLTMGAARQLSPMFLGKQINAVWHTGVVIGGQEYFFGCGIQQTRAGATPFGQPIRVENLGYTEVPKEVVADMIADLASSKFRPDSYNLLFNNCNHFSNELVMLLTGSSIPDDILNQAQEVLNTPMGEMLMPMLMQMEMQMGSVTANQASLANGVGAGVFGLQAMGPSTLNLPTLATAAVNPSVSAPSITNPVAAMPVNASSITTATNPTIAARLAGGLRPIPPAELPVPYSSTTSTTSQLNSTATNAGSVSSYPGSTTIISSSNQATQTNSVEATLTVPVTGYVSGTVPGSSVANALVQAGSEAAGGHAVRSDLAHGGEGESVKQDAVSTITEGVSRVNIEADAR